MLNALTPYRICQAAAGLIAEHGFEAVDMAAIARAADVAEADLYTLFGSKTDILLALYQRINADWQLRVQDLAARKLADRFEAAMQAKLALVRPYRGLLSQVMGLLLQPDHQAGVRSQRTAHIRAMGRITMQAVVDGASDAATLRRKLPQLPQLLYTVHWGLLFLSLYATDDEKPKQAVALAAKALKQAGDFSLLLRLFPVFQEAGAWAGTLVEDAGPTPLSIDREILRILFNSRKTTDALPECLAGTCATCAGLHEAKVHHFTQHQAPLHFILPAFPAKSPNREKVLGDLPDLGEEIALKALDDLCREVQAVYAPGAYLTICSDGRIFSSLVGVTDAAVTAYVAEIRSMIERLGLQHVRIVNLEDLLEGASFDALRQHVLDTYAEPLDGLQEKLKSSPEFKALFNGIHRFITEDRKALRPDLSTNKVKTESASIALRVIQHSNAWTRFLAYVYPDAIRLSIHPYPAHSDKIGIRLTKAADNWITPWHGVLVLGPDGYLLMKKGAAEALGARLVLHAGRPYYFTKSPEHGVQD